VFAILIAGGLGYWADGYFDSAPLYLVIGMVVGFAAFVLRLLRLGGQIEELSESEGPASSSEGADSRVASGAGQARHQGRHVDADDDLEDREDR
jgi:F0F1-type ATP synthase assembly protein I